MMKVRRWLRESEYKYAIDCLRSDALTSSFKSVCIRDIV